MFQVAILGFGIVGTGVAEVLEMNAKKIERKVGVPVELKYILDVRDCSDSPFAPFVVQNFETIEQDPEIDVVVETIGGVGVAYEFTRRALASGKSVVTSNKELVAQRGFELMTLAAEKGVNYLYEASVGGGVPILHPMSHCLVGNEMTEVRGILNGTTNYILSRMIQGGITFDEALKEAQEKGYAEKDPTADVEGQDACRKICILASLAFGRHIYPNQVESQGITKVSLEDVVLAGESGYQIKLLGRAILQEDGKVCAYVAPHLVSNANPLANVNQVFNAISVKANAVGEVMFYGPGAGSRATASAVVADIVDVVRGVCTVKTLEWAEGGDDVTVSAENLVSGWYVRGEGVCQKLRQVDGNVAITPPMSQKELLERLDDLVPSAMYRILLD